MLIFSYYFIQITVIYNPDYTSKLTYVLNRGVDGINSREPSKENIKRIVSLPFYTHSQSNFVVEVVVNIRNIDYQQYQLRSSV